MSLYQKIAEKLQYISPEFYKDRYFKNIKNATSSNYSQLNIEPELLWIREYLKNDAVFIDIGCNMGSFVFQLQDQLSPENIYAFEPNKNLLQRLKRIFPKVHFYPFALSDENTTANFKIPVINGKKINSRGTLNIDFKEVDEEISETQTVKVLRFDDWTVQEKINRIDFIKIDVEGNEFKTISGAKESILKFKPTLMVEIEQRHHQEPILHFISEIENWGFEIFYLNRLTFQLEKLTSNILQHNTHDEKNKEKYINNLIFIPKT